MEKSKCELCGEVMVTKKATLAEPYRYQMSGLDNVFLAGIDVRQCGKCGARVPVIDRKSTRLNSSHIQKSRMPSSA